MSSDALLFPELHAARYGDARRRARLILPKKLSDPNVQFRLAGKDQDDAFAIFQKWAGLEESGRLQKLNEVQLQGEFLTEVFGQALGYTLFAAGQPAWDLQPQFPVNGGTADGAIGAFRSDGPPSVRALIELKGPRVNVDRPPSTGGRTPVQQLWDYLNLRPECSWGILCNYVSFRVYHRDRGPRAYELFTLKDMAEKRETFNEFYALFERGGFLPERDGIEPRANRLLRESGERQREVGDELYERYSAERLDLIRHLADKQGKSTDEAIRIAQKLIDRIIFIAFCEDRELLTAKTLYNTFRNVPLYQRATNPRWRNFLGLFHAVDVGHVDLGIARGYNGNLFKPDSAIDNLELDDAWTQFFHEVGEYDFRDEINVDVLGNLFERSINELERLRVSGLVGDQQGPDRKGAGSSPTARRRGGVTNPAPPDPQMPKSAQRKRSGVYYTPPEFTRLIVERTVGTLLDERLAGVGQRRKLDLTTAPAPKQEPAHRDAWRECLQVTRDLKIVDPACGSGAFLIAAYDYLDERYNEICDRLDHCGEKAAAVRELRDQIPHFILAENLYGVDLSREAVEISQLALWIRSARPGRTLEDLSQHVVYGNSLVEDAQIDPAALIWRERFASVFDRPAGGFDCVIGNPPWERLKLQEREFFSLSAPKIAAAVSAAKRRQMIAKLEQGGNQAVDDLGARARA